MRNPKLCAAVSGSTPLPSLRAARRSSSARRRHSGYCQAQGLAVQKFIEVTGGGTRATAAGLVLFFDVQRWTAAVQQTLSVTVDTSIHALRRMPVIAARRHQRRQGLVWVRLQIFMDTA